jgi:hypothetical protein
MGSGETIGPKTRNTGIRVLRVADIEDHHLNFRTHPNSQREALAGAIAEIGWYGYPDCYIADNGKVRLIDGHLRREHLIAKYGPEATIEVNITDFDEIEARKAMLTHDPLSALAETNGAKLEELMSDVSIESASLRRMLDDLALGAPNLEDVDTIGLSDEGQPGDVNVQDMELQPEEHYDFILVLADNVNDWNRLVSLLELPHVKLSRTHRRIGMARAVRASKILEMIDAT